jgi:anti-anti-sigma factor
MSSMRAVGSHPGTDLTVSVSCDEGVALVALGGRLDADTVAVVRGQIEQLLEEGVREVLVDLAGVGLLDEQAARSLVDTARWTRAVGGTLHVFHVQGQPRETLLRLALRVDGPLLSAPRGQAA